MSSDAKTVLKTQHFSKETISFTFGPDQRSQFKQSDNMTNFKLAIANNGRIFLAICDTFHEKQYIENIHVLDDEKHFELASEALGFDENDNKEQFGPSRNQTLTTEETEPKTKPDTFMVNSTKLTFQK